MGLALRSQGETKRGQKVKVGYLGWRADILEDTASQLAKLKVESGVNGTEVELSGWAAVIG